MDVDEVKVSLVVAGAARRHGPMLCQPGRAVSKFRRRRSAAGMRHC
jgi:hypothetical protein